MEDWNIKIVDVGYKLSKDIYIFRRNFDGKTEMLNGEIFDHSGAILPKPTLELTNDQLRKFAEAINKEGINPQKEFIEGKLEATKEHLQDMRKLLKL